MTTSQRTHDDQADSRHVPSDFGPLVEAVRAAGLLERRLVHYGVRAVLTAASFAAVIVAIVVMGDSWYQLLFAPTLAIAFAQMAFLGHDAGHQAIFASRRHNDWLGRAVGNVLIGLSYGWWVDTHNRHHANPNLEDSDPDIGDGVLAFTTSQAARRNNALSRFVVRRQAWLFLPLTLLEGLSLHVDSAAAVITGNNRSSRGGTRTGEAAALLLHLALYVGLLALVMTPGKAVAVIAVNQAAWGLYMSLSFAPAHKGMPIIATGQRLDFLRKQVLTSRDVHGNVVTDFALGGLNYQIEHHLFPNMPRSSLRRAQPLIREHCATLGLPFHEVTLGQSYRAVLAHLNALGAPLRDAGSQPAR